MIEWVKGEREGELGRRDELDREGESERKEGWRDRISGRREREGGIGWAAGERERERLRERERGREREREGEREGGRESEEGWRGHVDRRERCGWSERGRGIGGIHWGNEGEGNMEDESWQRE